MENIIFLKNQEYFIGKTLFFFLKKNFFLSIASSAIWLKSGDIKINYKKANLNQILSHEDQLFLSSFFLKVVRQKTENISENFIRHGIKYNYYAEKLKKSILYENEQILCINKPYGIASQPGVGVKYCIQDFFSILSKNSNLKIVHRLDAETSGIFLLAKTDLAASNIGKLFIHRLVKKKYIAIIDNVNIKNNIFEVNEPIFINNEKKDAITNFKVILKMPNYIALEANPITGRKHQIRKHLAQNKMPIIGDKKYNGNCKLSKKLQLFASQIEVPGYITISLKLDKIDHAIYKSNLEESFYQS